MTVTHKRLGLGGRDGIGKKGKPNSFELMGSSWK
jgi:hypothetical protein